HYCRALLERIGVIKAIPSPPAESLLRSGASASAGGNLWTHELRGHATPTRNRHSNGARGAESSRAAPHRQAADGSGAHRRRDRIGGGARLDEAAEDFALRRERNRSPNVCRGRVATGGGGVAGLLHPGAPGDEGGSDSRAAL